MNRTRRKSTDRLIPIILLTIVGLMLLTAGLLPASRTAIAGALSLSEDHAWLEMVDKPNQIYTEFSLSHLSGRLINFGMVDASKCENSGLNSNGSATECGINAAQPAANEWQNRFNAAILATSKKQNIPPRLLKNLFAWESQFWPETTYTTAYEYGLGHITMNGADSALRWDTGLYDEICAASFSKEACKKDLYGYQPEDFRNALQGVLAQKVNADCSSCKFNLDMAKAEKSIPYIGKVLQANAVYVRYAVKIFTGKEAEDLVSPDDLWRFTLTSYNAGPGCYRTALSNLYYRGLDLTWKNMKAYLEPACKGSIPYVDFISKTSAYHPDDDPSLHPTPTIAAQPTATPAPISLDAPHKKDEAVIKIDADHLDSALKSLQILNINKEQVGQPIDPSGSRVIQVPDGKLGDVLAALRSNPNFLSAEPNYLVSMASLPVGFPDDPLYATGQPNLVAAQVYNAWDTLSIAANPGSPVLVAVVDTGVDSTHPDLAGKIWTNPGETNCSDGKDDDHNGYVDDCHGWNTTNRTNNISDDNGHGTEMAGVIGALTNNTTGIAGIAPNAQILPVKVLLSNGVGTHSWASEGIIYAANMGARIIYLGFASSISSDILTNAVAYAVSKGAIVIAPSGNDSATINNYPASYPGVISVSAVDNNGTIASFSTRSSFVSLAAPGVNILSTAPGNAYQTVSGTSLSAAHVAGVAAMLAGQPQFLNHNDLLQSAILSSVLDAGAVGRDPVYGYGILRANNAISATSTATSVQITAPTPSAVFAVNQSITFSGLALDAVNTNISSRLVWTSNIDGPIGNGATFTTSKLTPGAHSVKAEVISAIGVVEGSAKLDIRVMEASGPHGNFAADTSTCAACHDSHSVNGADPGSAANSNNFCLSCHNGSRARAVSTHGNLSSHTLFQKQEQNFELLCVQCHDPHDGTGNIFAIRQHFVLGSRPTSFSSMVAQTNPINFTTLNPLSPSSLNDLCISCHQDPGNPGYPMASHDDGSIHNQVGDQTGQACIFCHYHDLDGDPATSDGFMPANPQYVTKQAQGSPTPAISTTPVPAVTTTPVPTQATTLETPVPTARFKIETSVPTWPPKILATPIP